MSALKWAELREKIVVLTLRERAILAATLVVVIVVIWFQFSFDAKLKAFDQIALQSQQAGDGIVAGSEAMSTLQVQLANDPNTPLRAERERLEQNLERVGRDIEARLEHLVAPERMAELVRQVLSDYKGLTLISAENLAAEPLKFDLAKAAPKKPTKDKSDVQEASDQAVIFEHGFKLTLQGTYFNALEFVQKLEQIDGFYWRVLDYEVKDYPNAIITIHVSTLSLDKEWIGV